MKKIKKNLGKQNNKENKELNTKNSIKSLDNIKSNTIKEENDLVLLLNEADKITLNDLDFDTILKEQSTMLCNINNIISKEGKVKGQFDSKNKDNNPLCNIVKLNNDSKFKNMLSKYKKKLNTSINKIKTKKTISKKIVPKKNAKQINLFKYKATSINYATKKSSKKSRSKKSRSKKSRSKKSSSKKSRSKKSRTKKCNKKARTITINRISVKNKNKFLYKYNNRRNFDVTITNPQIYIKNNNKNKKL